MQAPSFWCTDTVYSADSVEFSPHHPSILAIGTYQIETPAPAPSPPPPKVKSEGEGEDGESSSDEEDYLIKTPAAKRKGRCLVYDVQGETVNELQRIDGPAILDMKWNPRLDAQDRSVLAIADAEGRLVTYAWDDKLRKLEEMQTLQVTDPKTLVLSLDWSNRISQSATPPTVITSLSSLELSHLTYDTTGQLAVAQTWSAHDYEPWVASFDGWNGGNVVYSGGDDCKMKAWDVRTENESPLWVNKRFDAGVTCIQTSPHIPNLIAVGSYNETLTLLDPRSPLRPLLSTPIPLGGGAWRVKFHPSPSRPNDLVVACMHGGFKVFRLDSSLTGEQGREEEAKEGVEGEDWGEGWRLVARNDQHESLAYGVDWSRDEENVGEDGKGGTVVGSCSFYDHEARLWRA